MGRFLAAELDVWYVLSIEGGRHQMVIAQRSGKQPHADGRVYGIALFLGGILLHQNPAWLILVLIGFSRSKWPNVTEAQLSFSPQRGGVGGGGGGCLRVLCVLFVLISPTMCCYFRLSELFSLLWRGRGVGGGGLL